MNISNVPAMSNTILLTTYPRLETQGFKSVACSKQVTYALDAIVVGVMCDMESEK